MCRVWPLFIITVVFKPQNQPTKSKSHSHLTTLVNQTADIDSSLNNKMSQIRAKQASKPIRPTDLASKYPSNLANL